MKITKSQLKEIIREELEAVLEEGPVTRSPESEEALERAMELIRKEFGDRMIDPDAEPKRPRKVPYEQPHVPRDPVDRRYGRYPGRSGKGKLGS